jgi:(S)-2-hydroxyglutarate dehydrogenase
MSILYDIAVIGGGIVGTSAAMSLQKTGRYHTVVLEAEDELAKHQTGNNSGVIHSGLYYKPGSLKAQNCAEGRELLYQFCEKYGIKHERCGKLVVAVNPLELPKLDELEKRGIANGLSGIKRITKDEIKEYEPNADGIAGLFIPQTGIVNYKEVTEKFASIIDSNGGEIKKGYRVLSVKKAKDRIVLNTSGGEINCKYLINCGGLYSDKIASMCGIKTNIKIIPFRGEYYKLAEEKEYLVKNLIYPVPDPRFPFLGVHFTRMIKGGVEAGPNAVLAFKREGYKRNDISIKDTLEFFTYPGFWKMAAKYYKMGFGEFYRSYNKRAFVKALSRLIPEISIKDITPGGSGVRAQALDSNGRLLDDFVIEERERMIHVLNAPSPAATASIAIGRKIAERVINGPFKFYKTNIY